MAMLETRLNVPLILLNNLYYGRQLVRSASKRTDIVDHRLMDGNVRSISNCPSIVGHQVLDGNVSSTSIRPTIVSNPRLNGIFGNACQRPKYCCTTTCRWQLVRYASKRTGIVDHRLMNGNVRSTSTCPSIISLQILDSN